MKNSKKVRFLLVIGVATGVLGLAGAASSGTQIGASVSISGTRTTVVDSAEQHVCTYEQRPVTRTYTDATGGSYEHRTYETVRVCTHAPEYYSKVAPAKVYKEKRPKARKERRKNRQTSYSVGVGYYGGSPSLHVGVGYNTSTYHGPYPIHHYEYYGHRGYSSYGHHYPHSSVSLSFGFGGPHRGHGHRSFGHHGHH